MNNPFQHTIAADVQIVAKNYSFFKKGNIMKRLFIISIIVFGAVTAFSQSGKDKMQNGKVDSGSKFVYTCTMHPEVMTDKPGKCPKCGMPLVKKKVDKIYSCTMNPEVISDKPGKCPKCGMDLVEKKSGAKMKS